MSPEVTDFSVSVSEGYGCNRYACVSVCLSECGVPVFAVSVGFGFVLCVSV